MSIGLLLPPPVKAPPTGKLQIKMDNHVDTTSPFTDINGLVAVALYDVAEGPVPLGAEPVLAEIRQTVSEGNATVDMALAIIDLFPYE